MNGRFGPSERSERVFQPLFDVCLKCSCCAFDITRERSIEQLRRQSSQTEANALTVRLELQADCLSGVWARAVNGLLEPGDMEEALNAARMIGDDHLQKRAGRVPQPHTFTHGTSAQRARWFTKGYKSGDMNSCDTFSARTL